MIPLVDLHRHLEGSIRPETSIELATRIGTDVLPAQWRSALVAAEREEGLLPYLAKIENATALVRTLDDWHRVTVEAVSDAFGDGLAAVELRFSPEFIAGVTGLDADDVIDAVSDAVSGVGLPIEVGLIGIVVRDEGPDSAVAQVGRLLRHQSALVGADLAGDEAGYPAALFAPAFRLAHDEGLAVTIHAGEAAGPQSVWDALSLAPRRIGHGVRSAEDPRLLAHLAASGVTLEVAITSNVQTGAARGRAQHQLATLVAAGVRVALCTDNPAVSDTRLTREYELARDLVDPASVDVIRQNALAARFAANIDRPGKFLKDFSRTVPGDCRPPCLIATVGPARYRPDRARAAEQGVTLVHLPSNRKCGGGAAMAPIVVVHGVGQQAEGELTLHDRYFSALKQGMARAGRTINPDDVVFASYGEFFRPQAEVLSPAPYFDAESVADGYESELLSAFWRRAASVDPRVVPPGEEVLGRSPVWASRALAALSRSRYFAGLADRLLIGDLKQVRRYFSDTALRTSIRLAVAGQLSDDTRVVVAHSLGTVVAYEVLCSAGGPVSLSFVSLGSPLGLPNLVFDRLQPAPRPDGADPRGHWPARVRAWTNLADAGDVVALVEDLRPLFGRDIRQIRVHNGAHAHDMAPYLTEEQTGGAIAAGLNGE